MQKPVLIYTRLVWSFAPLLVCKGKKKVTLSLWLKVFNPHCSIGYLLLKEVTNVHLLNLILAVLGSENDSVELNEWFIDWLTSCVCKTGAAWLLLDASLFFYFVFSEFRSCLPRLTIRHSTWEAVTLWCGSSRHDSVWKVLHLHISRFRCLL